MRIILNNKENNHLKQISDLFENSENIFIAVAFFKMSGLNLIKTLIEKALKKKIRVEIVCGLDFYQTEPSALKELYELTKIYTNLNSQIFSSKGNITFHPKIYSFTQKNKCTLIIGSANFTKGGFVDNFELSTINTIESTSQEFLLLENWKESIMVNSEKVNDINLSQYARKYQIYNRNIKNAQNQSKKEENAVFSLNLSLVERFLKGYLSNKDEQANLILRKDNYNKAKIILEKIRLENIDDETFFDLYETLVGRAKEKSLWHSGSIGRLKNKVKEHRLQFKSLLNEIVKANNKSPKETFNLLENFYKKGNSEKITGLGPNILTEILNTYYPEKFAVLNDNPLTSIKYFGFEEFPSAQNFKPNNYQDFNTLIYGLMKTCNFETLGQVDHFLNYIYWQVKDTMKEKKP